MAEIMIVEDEPVLRNTIRAVLQEEGHTVHAFGTGEDATEWLETHQADLALLDIRLPGHDGLYVLEHLRTNQPETVVVMMTAHGDVRTAVRAMRAGAADFLSKPLDLDAVTMIVHRELTQRRMRLRLAHEQDRQKSEFGLHRIIGRCDQIERLRALVRRICGLGVAGATQPPNVLITGETGTGKDLFARAFHFEGPRRAQPFVQVNCAALPEALMESELFGHMKGAFTDARSDKRGLFEVADGGTLFLDEVHTLPMALQAKLLLAIEQGRIRPVGATDDRAVDIHLIAAMNRDPERMVAEGQFREDLFHRLRVIHAQIPPLRDRGNDLDMLVEYFVAGHCRKFGMPPKSLSPAAARAIRKYHWPGNVRELGNCLESAVLLSGETIEPDVLPGAGPGTESAQERNGSRTWLDFSNGPIPLEHVERDLLCGALEKSGQNVSKAAELLCISRDTMRYRMEKHGIHIRGKGERARSEE